MENPMLNSNGQHNTMPQDMASDVPCGCESCSPEPESVPAPWKRGGGLGFEPADDAGDAALPLDAAITETWT